MENYLYKYIRGSWCHGLGIEGVSDYDYSGVYCTPIDNIIGLPSNYVTQMADEKNDEVYYEFGRWCELLEKSNPNVIEGLFVDKEFIVGDVHPIMQAFIDNRDLFLTKKLLNSLYSFSMTQVKKAVGYNKKSQIPEDFQRKDILDFCYTFKKQGSTPIKEWLKDNWLDQKYCGLVNIPNMQNVFGVYYDFAAYFKFENIEWYDKLESHGHIINCVHYPYSLFIGEDDVEKIQNRIDNKEFFKYPGIVNPDENSKSTDVRLCSIPKNEKPICFMTYNKDGYITHCKKYKEWSEWKEKRNQQRYIDNKGYNFDAKNMCETVRLLHTALELARDGKFNVKRTWDRDFLLKIKHHEMNYNELSEYIANKSEELNLYTIQTNLPEDVDSDYINDLLISGRKQYYNFNIHF